MDFEMVREIQRGSHATVWLVRKRQTKDVFAMKVIDRKSGRLNRLQTERKVLFLCSSPFVVKTFFAFEDADSLYLVMERLHQDCKHVLQASGAMLEQTARPIMADLLLALEHLHSCGIVHRDLKPENMLLTSAGRLKLADFGLSHISARAAHVRLDDVTKDPSIVGTPFYMAPETIRGKAKGYESAADWWSFGVIMYECLLGFPPFQGSKVGEIYRSILSLAFTVPIQACAISPEAVDLIQRLLVPDPRRRLCGASYLMTHAWFRSIDWHEHGRSAGHAGALLGGMPGSLHALAAAGGSLPSPGPGAMGQMLLGSGAVGMPPPPPSLHGAGGPAELSRVNSTNGSLGSKASLHAMSSSGLATAHALGLERSGDLGSSHHGGARSVHSLGMESERSAASTHLPDLLQEGGETTAHLDNLMGLNEVPSQGKDMEHMTLG